MHRFLPLILIALLHSCAPLPAIAQQTPALVDASTGELKRPVPATFRSANGLAIGTDVQAYNANLAQLAALSLIADRLPYANGTGTLSLATFTSFARDLLDDATAAAGATTLGLGTGNSPQFTALTLTGNLNVSDGFTMSSSGSIALTAAGTNENVTLTPSGTGKVVLSTGSTGYVDISGGAGIFMNWPTGDRGIQISPTTSGLATMQLAGWSAAGAGSTLTFQNKDATNGNSAAIAALSSGSLNIGRIQFNIENHADAAGNMAFYTRATTAGGLLERMRIAKDGNLLIGGTTDITGTGGLKVFGTTASTSTTSGSGQFAGGIGVAGAGWFGGQVNASHSSSSSANASFSNTNASGYGLLSRGGSTVVSTQYVARFADYNNATALTVYSDKTEIASTTEATTAGAGSLTTAGGIYTAKKVVAMGGLLVDKTVTAGGTTGAQVINKPAGTVNFAAAATSLVVTNSLVTTSSIIICTVGTNDTTMHSVQAVAGSGSFTLYPNAAPTGETRVNFHIIN